jgi:hypothetical protein
MVKDLHNNGLTTPIFDPEILRVIGQTAGWTFDDRITMICRVLKVYFFFTRRLATANTPYRPPRALLLLSW